MGRALFMMLALGIFAGAQEGPVGIVTSAQGDVQIFEPGIKKGRKVQFADVLTNGSRVVTGVDGKISFVSCPQSVAATALPKSNLQFTKAGFAVITGSVEKERKAPACRVAPARSSGTHIGGTAMRGQSTMQLDAPVGIVVPEGPVTLSWKAVDGATDYRVTLRDEGGNDFWESEVKSTSATYSGPPRLAMGKSYRWSVTALEKGDVLSSASAMLRVVSAEESQRIAELRAGLPAENEGHLLLGMLYEELNMPAQALAEYQKLPAPAPGGWLAAEMAALQQRLSNK